MKKFKFKKLAIGLTTALAVTAFFPANMGEAASANSQINKVFKQVGLSNPLGVKSGQAATPAPSQPEQPPKQQPQPKQPPQQVAPSPTQPNVKLADRILLTGEKYLGTPYQYGARSGQTNTFDCSSFVQHVYRQHGIALPRSSRQQSQVGTYVPRNQLQKGDLLFFKLRGSNQIGHVAIYAGNNRVLHTWGPGGVRYDSLSAGWLDQGYVSAKRVIK